MWALGSQSSSDQRRRLEIWVPAFAGMSAMLLAVAMATPALAQLMTWADLTRRPDPVATRRIAYGQDPAQVADLWLPSGPGPHPVVVMIHGGCWQASISNLKIMDWAAEDLRKRGLAVWNIEYRGVDQPGGGYPGTFQDVAAAADALKAAADADHLDLSHVVAVGHSAGGHFALWLAGRPKIAASSPLHADHPLPIAAVVSLGGLPDLRQDLKMAGAGCGPEPVRRLVGLASGRTGEVFADTSPAELLPLGARQMMVQGELDPVSPPFVGYSWQARAKKAGERARVIVVPGAGHAELIAPGAQAWERAAKEIVGLAHGR